MKKIYSAFLLLSLLFATNSCNKEMPYPIDEVKRGVAIDIVRVSGTDPVLYSDQTDGNFKIALTIPEQQGDYSHMKNAQLLAILEDADKTVTSRVVVDNITEFPKEIQLNMADIYSKFGLTAPAIGETLYFSVNVVLNNGDVIPGWTEHEGFNNRAFVGWRVDGRAFSYNVRYSVVCELLLDAFVGPCTVTLDEWWGAPYPVEVIKVSDNQLAIRGLFEGDAADLIIDVNAAEYTVSFGKQVLVPAPTWWGTPIPYNDFALGGGTGVINACETVISFTATATVDAGSFGNVSFEISK